MDVLAVPNQYYVNALGEITTLEGKGKEEMENDLRESLRESSNKGNEHRDLTRTNRQCPPTSNPYAEMKPSIRFSKHH